MMGLSPKGLVSIKEKEEMPEILCDACTEKKPCKDMREGASLQGRERPHKKLSLLVGNSV